MANYMNYLSGVGLYVLLILVLYGQKEILPKTVYKQFGDTHLKAPTRDKSAKPLPFKEEVGKLVQSTGAKSVHELGEALKPGQ